MNKNKILQEPQSIEAEQAVLGAMILDREAISRVIELLDEKSFYSDAHQRLYLAITNLYDKNIPVDLVILVNELKKQKELKVIGGATFLAELLERVVSSANVIHYAKIVRDYATSREMIRVYNRLIEAGYQGDDIDELLEKTEQLTLDIKEKRIEKGFINIRPILRSSFDLIEKLYEKKERVTGIPSGFIDLDNLTTGFQPSDLIIVAGRPSMGKTAFCLNIAEHVAITHGIGVGIFSLEMSKEQVVIRMLCSQAEVFSQKIRTGYLEKSDWPRLTRASGSLAETEIFIDDTAGIPILELRAKARRLKAAHDIKLLIVDYIQLITGPKSESRQQEVSAISMALKGLAKELSIPVIAVSQLSRAVEQRRIRRPRLSDLRESGAIEQDADVVMFVYRDEQYHPTLENKGLADIMIEKQRNGPTGIAKLAFIGECTKFRNLAKVFSDNSFSDTVEG